METEVNNSIIEIIENFKLNISFLEYLSEEEIKNIFFSKNRQLNFDIDKLYQKIKNKNLFLYSDEDDYDPTLYFTIDGVVYSRTSYEVWGTYHHKIDNLLSYLFDNYQMLCDDVFFYLIRDCNKSLIQELKNMEKIVISSIEDIKQELYHSGDDNFEKISTNNWYKIITDIGEFIFEEKKDCFICIALDMKKVLITSYRYCS